MAMNDGGSVHGFGPFAQPFGSGVAPPHAPAAHQTGGAASAFHQISASASEAAVPRVMSEMGHAFMPYSREAAALETDASNEQSMEDDYEAEEYAGAEGPVISPLSSFQHPFSRRARWPRLALWWGLRMSQHMAGLHTHGLSKPWHILLLHLGCHIAGLLSTVFALTGLRWASRSKTF